MADDIDSTSTKKLPELIGYLTFVSFPAVGVVGGLLLVNELARPVAFHCTAPVPESRVHEILYGSTHRVSLFSDHIGKALFDHARVSRQLALLITDEPDAVELRSKINVPLALLRTESAEVLDTSRDESTARQAITRGLSIASREEHADVEASSEESYGLSSEWSLELGGHSFTNSPSHPEDREPIRNCLMRVSSKWELSEPFQRIRDAIEEAQRAAA